MSIMDPLTEHLARTGHNPDPAQEAALQKLRGLVGADRRRHRRRSTARGLYLWGPSGRGKSWLMNAFFATASVDAKRRMHLHEFLHELQRMLATQHDLDAVLDRLLGDTELLCFDEFHVHDVADARYLAALSEAVLRRKLILVVTSNYPPGELLPNPLAHQRFTPTIAAIEKHLDVVEVDGGRDYRTTAGPRGAYLWPGAGRDDGGAPAALPEDPADEPVPLDLGGRSVTARQVRGTEVRFTFSDLCGAPTGTADYLLLADRFSSWVVTDVPVLVQADREPRRRLCNLLDVLTDRDAHVVLAGEHPPQVTFGGVPDVDWARTESRLRALTGW
ncbi:cell division protein ZapE [Rhodococcus sp. D2-41]|uniref:cell division protein ZapE n=1 Tax=Speluncibacter jeojiensis TaxID=2710754 RepID=UPI00240F6166|nr:cell division protein ZapE [Rhodococcus sp. D2-41]MDG3012539.1 cell division protein ZapE [Rhodococcus sp. D2-41]